LSIDDNEAWQCVIENILLSKQEAQRKSPLGSMDAKPEDTMKNRKIQRANSCAEALEYLATAQVMPNVILLELKMRDMSGAEACVLIRERHTKLVPILFHRCDFHFSFQPIENYMRKIYT
jgi:CheY-like chemotaxis protein